MYIQNENLNIKITLFGNYLPQYFGLLSVPVYILNFWRQVSNEDYLACSNSISVEKTLEPKGP